MHRWLAHGEALLEEPSESRVLKRVIVLEVLVVIAEILLCLLPIFVATRYGSIGLIGVSGLSVFILVFVFRLPPASPPMAAIFIILSVIFASAAMQAAGGLDYLVHLAAKAMRKRPNQIAFFGPIITFFFSLLSGTGNIAFALFPVLYELSLKNNVRPERALATSAITSQLALIASPVAALTATYLAIVEPHGATLGGILAVTVPAALVSVVVTSLVMSRWGKELDTDPVYLAKVAAGEVDAPRTSTAGTDEHPLPKGAALSAVIFVSGVLVVVLLGLFSFLRPLVTADGTSAPVSMSIAIPTVMLAIAGAIVLCCKVKAPAVMKSDLLVSGLIAAMVILTVPVLFGTVLNAHMTAVTSFVTGALAINVGLFAVILFLIAALVMSQAAAVQIVVPIALAAGLAVGPMTGMLAAAGGNNMLASIGGMGQAVIQIDKTGSTKPGSFILNGSFTVPTIVSVVVAVAVGLGMQFLLG